MELKDINSKIVQDGQKLPSVTLKNGAKVQTGTVAALLHNIKLYNAFPSAELEEELRLAVPTLIQIGLFDLFSTEEWMVGSNPGRKLVGQIAHALGCTP